MALLWVLSNGSAPEARAQEAGFTTEGLASWWDGHHVDLPRPPLITHAEVDTRLQRVAASDPGFFTLATLGASNEGRAIRHLAFGRGPFHVLMWSQMHGDEPTATRALFDLIAFFHMRRDEPAVARMLDALTIHMVPMLNPDGAERFQRRNLQGIDINRDALMLQTPEGRLLKDLRDQLNPRLGFNLHNQGWRTSVAGTGQPASISLLAVSFDEARSDNPGRLLAKKVAGVMRDSIEPLAAGRIGKYDDEFEPRAFGDNITKWGTPVVLVETGPWPGPDHDTHLVRLNFVLLVSALDALATGRAEAASPDRYESLPFNGSSVLYQLIRRATVVMGNGVAPFRADIGITGTRTVRPVEGQRTIVIVKRIDEWGDLSTFGGLEEIDGSDLWATPIWSPALKIGDVVTLPDFASRTAATIGPAQPANLVLLKPVGNDRFRVDRLIMAEEIVR
ncbi:MAG: M14 family metallopeptidase [Vicinamibacterales bacterium]|nr:M14 family metallopeptidase [Vicinamibacterales bacterium]